VSESHALSSILFEFSSFYTRNLETIQPLSGRIRSLPLHYAFTGKLSDIFDAHQEHLISLAKYLRRWKRNDHGFHGSLRMVKLDELFWMPAILEWLMVRLPEASSRIHNPCRESVPIPQFGIFTFLR